MSFAVEGYGSFISAGPSLSALTRMAEVVKISGPSNKVKSLDVSNLDSPVNRNEFIPGMVDEGEITLELNFTAAEFSSIRSLMPLSGAYVGGTSGLSYFSITFSTGSVYSGQGFITALEPTAPVDDKISATCTIKCSGAWAFVV